MGRRPKTRGDSSSSDAESDSAPESFVDYIPLFGRLSEPKIREIHNGYTHKFRFTDAEKAAVFRHSVNKTYSGRQPPDQQTFTQLILEVLPIPRSSGFKVASTCIIAAANLVQSVWRDAAAGPLVQEFCTGKNGRQWTWEIHVSAILPQVVNEAGFKWNMVRGGGALPIQERHASTKRLYLQVETNDDATTEGWTDLTDSTMQHLVRAGQINGKRCEPPPRATPATPQPIGFATAAGGSGGSGAYYSAIPKPLFEADKASFNGEKLAYQVMLRYRQRIALDLQANGPDADPPKRYVRTIDWHPDTKFHASMDYQSWLNQMMSAGELTDEDFPGEQQGKGKGKGGMKMEGKEEDEEEEED